METYICHNNFGLEDQITLGKEYYIKPGIISDLYYIIRNDNDKSVFMDKWRFITLVGFRDQQLDKLIS